MKMGRTKLKCNGVVPEENMWSQAAGKDPDIDYLKQFINWPGFDAWLDSVRIKVIKESDQQAKSPVKHIEELDEEVQECIEWLLEFLPEVPSSQYYRDEELSGSVISDESLEQLESMLLSIFENDKSPEEDIVVHASAILASSRNSRNKNNNISALMDRASASSKRITDSINNINGKNESRKKEGKKVSLAEENKKKSKTNKNGKKGKNATASSKKLNKMEEQDTKEDTEPVSQMPQLLELFAEFDAIERAKEDFYKAIQDKVYPEDPSIALSPPSILILSFHQYQVYKVNFSVVNTSAKVIQLLFNKINSSQYFNFKVIGPTVTKIAPGGYQNFRLEFCSEDAENVEGYICYLIRNYDHSLTQKLLPVSCFSCCYEAIELSPERTVTLTEQTHSLSQ